MLIKSLKLLGLVAIAAVVLIDPAFADSDVFATATTKAKTTFTNVRTIIFIVGGFGLVGLAFAAIFGKVNWKWFAALAVGLFVLAVAGAIVKYATGTQPGWSDSMNSSTSGAIQETL